MNSSELTLLEKKLADEPIILPEDLFWAAFKSFGMDELVAAGISVVGTAGMNHFVQSHAAEWSKASKACHCSRWSRDRKSRFFPRSFVGSATGI